MNVNFSAICHPHWANYSKPNQKELIEGENPVFL